MPAVKSSSRPAAAASRPSAAAFDPRVPQRYGICAPRLIPDWELEMIAFREGLGEAHGGFGKYGHYRRLMDYWYPELQWNDWLERMTRTFCDDSYATVSGGTTVRVVSMVGVAGAGKTFAAGLFAYAWWFCALHESVVILTSTTKDAIGQRVWPVIQFAHHTAHASVARLHNCSLDKIIFPNLVDSRKILQRAKGDDKFAIFAQAVKDGETSRAEAFIRGQHAPRVMVVIDEAGETPEAIYGAISNLRKGCRELLIVIIDNAVSRLNPHGRCCAPRGGWGMRPPGATSWLTAGVPEWQIDPGICLQFRGSDSPNVKAGRTIHPRIYTFEDYQNSLREGVRNTLRYWRYDAGEWAPDGVCNTVFNETRCVADGIQDGVLWLDKPVPVTFLDPGFGGDACVQVLGRYGTAVDGTAAGRKTLLLDRVVELSLSPDARDANGKLEDYEHQIARQYKANCEAHGVQSKHAGLFSTGTGRGVASILFTDWSDQILKVEEGGAPSDQPVSLTDQRPAKEAYDRRVTELWFSAQSFAHGGQLRGVDNATLVELCAREYELAGKPAKARIETKDEFRPKLGHSPDRADAFVGLCWLVRARLGGIGGRAGIGDSVTDWNKRVAEQQDVDGNPGFEPADPNEEAMAMAGLADDDSDQSWRSSWPER